MHPVSLFPSFLDYGFLATGILRMTLGIIFIWFAYVKFFPERMVRIAFFEKLGLKPALLFFILTNSLELVAGVLLVVGLFTQAAALVAGILMTLAALIKWRRPGAKLDNPLEFYILFAVVSFALIASGPGAFAFDLAV